MEYFEIIGIVLGFLFLTVLIIVQINRMRETKKMKAEREKCFSMISRCSQLLCLWETCIFDRYRFPFSKTSDLQGLYPYP